MEDDIAVLELSGTLKLGPSLVDFRNKAREILNANQVKALFVDVGSVSHTDSSGLGELTVVYTLANKKSCPMRLINMQPELKKLLEMTHLDRVLPSSPDVASARSELKKK
jgi:anti-sigma B factor antagonist